jgi:hypothetical protein
MIESRRSFGLGLALIGALLGCSSGGDDDLVTAGAGIGAAGADASGPPPCPSDTPAFHAGPAGIGLEAVGNKQLAKVRVIDAMPKTPVKYENDWTVAFLDAQGLPLADAQLPTLVAACARMPVHAHTEPPKSIQPGTEPGTFKLHALNLSMVGPWEVQLAVSSPTLGGTADQYTLCDTHFDSPGNDLIVLRTCISDPE